MLPSANIWTAVEKIRLGEEVNSGLTQPNRTADSQNPRNTTIASVPSHAFSLRRQNEFCGGGRRPPAACASFDLLSVSTFCLTRFPGVQFRRTQAACSTSPRVRGEVGFRAKRSGAKVSG